MNRKFAKQDWLNESINFDIDTIVGAYTVLEKIANGEKLTWNLDSDSVESHVENEVLHYLEDMKLEQTMIDVIICLKHFSQVWAVNIAEALEYDREELLKKKEDKSHAA